MFTKRKQRKAPKGGHKPGVMALLEQAAVELAAKGKVRVPASPWLKEANILLSIRKGCGWNREDTPTTMVEERLRYLNWTWRWEGEDLVLELPAWEAPAARIVAIQPRLLD